jgi:hypothetical protein
MENFPQAEFRASTAQNKFFNGDQARLGTTCRDRTELDIFNAKPLTKVDECARMEFKRPPKFISSSC